MIELGGIKINRGFRVLAENGKWGFGVVESGEQVLS